MLSRKRLSGHEESSNIDVCAWSPAEESVLITAGTDRKVFLWDLSGGDDKGSFKHGCLANKMVQQNLVRKCIRFLSLQKKNQQLFLIKFYWSIKHLYFALNLILVSYIYVQKLILDSIKYKSDLLKQPPVRKELHLESSSDGGACVHWSNDGKRFAVGECEDYWFAIQ